MEVNTSVTNDINEGLSAEPQLMWLTTPSYFITTSLLWKRSGWMHSFAVFLSTVLCLTLNLFQTDLLWLNLVMYGSQFLFYLFVLWFVPALLKWGKVAHLIFCFLFKKTNVYLCMHIAPLYVSRNYECKSVRCLISLLGDVALLGVLLQV